MTTNTRSVDAFIDEVCRPPLAALEIRTLRRAVAGLARRPPSAADERTRLAEGVRCLALLTDVVGWPAHERVAQHAAVALANLHSSWTPEQIATVLGAGVHHAIKSSLPMSRRRQLLVGAAYSIARRMLEAS